MPSQTVGGLPYPLPAEPVRDGAVAIKNLATAADNVAAWSVRPTTDAIPAATWGNMVGFTQDMPAGTYLVTATCLWRGEVDGACYTFLDALVNGAALTRVPTYGGYTASASPICHVLTSAVTHPGGVLSFLVKFGFSNQNIYAVAGSSVVAIRLGP